MVRVLLLLCLFFSSLACYDVARSYGSIVLSVVADADSQHVHRDSDHTHKASHGLELKWTGVDEEIVCS